MKTLFEDNRELLNPEGETLYHEAKDFLHELFEKWDDVPSREVEAVVHSTLAEIANQARGDVFYNQDQMVKFERAKAEREAKLKAEKEAKGDTEEEEDDCSSCSSCGCGCPATSDDDETDEVKNETPADVNTYKFSRIIDDDDAAMFSKIAAGFTDTTVQKTSGKVISEFIDEYEFLRNDYPCVQNSLCFYEDGDGSNCSQHVVFKTVEQAYQANKTFDQDAQKIIIDAPDARTAVALGRKSPIISDWDNKRLVIMERLLEDKFQNLEMKIKLLETGDNELVMGNSKDKYWGITRKDEGENNLGKLLMQLRSKILDNEGTLEEILTAKIKREGLGFILPWITFPN